MSALLEIAALSRRFSGLLAVDGVDMSVARGSIHAVIGPNGAGKTTLFNLVSGVLPASGGAIRLEGADITALPAERRAALGIARTFQNIRLFPTMTVLENVLTGMQTREPVGLLGTILRTPGFRAQERASLAAARAAREFVGLAGRAEARAGLVRALRDRGATILLVEHDMQFVMGLSDHVTVLNFGRRIFDGPPGRARRDPGVVEAYLGAKVAARLAEGAA